MILSDILSREKHDESNPPEIIPASFNIQRVLHVLPGKSMCIIFMLHVGQWHIQ